MNGRETAYKTLLDVEKNKAYSNLTLGELKLEGRERALAYSLTLGVLERKLTLDFLIERHLTQPIKKLKPEVLTVLRLGAYQILFADRIPESAAVNESVKLIKKTKHSYASGLVNAVLRKVAKDGLTLPEGDSVEDLSVKYSFLPETIEAFLDYYGAELTEKILSRSLGIHPVYVRANSLKSVPLPDCFHPVERLGGCYTVGDDANLPEYIREGKLHVQGFASQLLCSAIGVKPGMSVCDVCAAPGGKTATMAQLMNDEGSITSCDVHEHRLKLIEDGVKRLGITSVKTRLRDASDSASTLPPSDIILADVPCSGIGDAPSKPEVKYKPYSDAVELSGLQSRILEASSGYVKPGGKLVYSTCSLYDAENSAVVKEFLNNHNEFEIEEHELITNEDIFIKDGMVTVLPFECDGLFFAVMKRVKS